MAQNRRILDGLTDRSIHFVQLEGTSRAEGQPQMLPLEPEGPPPEEDVFEGTIDFSGGAAEAGDTRAASNKRRREE